MFARTPLLRTAVALLALLAAPLALGVTVRFDDGVPRPVDDLVYGPLTFDFKVLTVDSIDATYGYTTRNAVPFTHIDAPFLEGSAYGALTLTFAGLVDRLAFDFVVNSGSAVTHAVRVRVYDEHNDLLRTTTANASPISFFAEGSFQYDGDPFVRAVVEFSTNFYVPMGTPRRFGMDNLYFEGARVTVPSAVPVPTAVWLLASALLPLSALTRRRSR